MKNVKHLLTKKSFLCLFLGFIITMLMACPAQDKQTSCRKIARSIIDREYGQIIAGVNVLVKKTTIGTGTNIDINLDCFLQNNTLD